MVQLVRKRGHSITGDVGPATATVIGTRADNGDTMTVTWTLDMADRAGLLNKSNWKKYPEAMLWARAASQLCRMLFADCFAGNTYTPEELGDDDPGSGGEPTGDASPAQATSLDDAPASPPDDPAEGTPFSYDIEAAVEPAGAAGAKPITEPQKKKANVLVGQLRPEHISTLQLWQSMGREPVPSEDGLLHWSPLRDSLTRVEATRLIDRLESFAGSIEDGSYFERRAKETLGKAAT